MTSPVSPSETIEKAMEGVKKVADGHYCRALDQFEKTPCLGAEYKMKNGLFGMTELEAHGSANKTMGHHFGMYEAIRLLEPAFAEVLALALKLEAMQREMAELREAASFVKPAMVSLKGYERDLGDSLLDEYELGRIEESRQSPSFRIRVGHIRRLARTLIQGEKK